MGRCKCTFCSETALNSENVLLWWGAILVNWRSFVPEIDQTRLLSPELIKIIYLLSYSIPHLCLHLLSYSRFFRNLHVVVIQSLKLSVRVPVTGHNAGITLYVSNNVKGSFYSFPICVNRRHGTHRRTGCRVCCPDTSVGQLYGVQKFGRQVVCATVSAIGRHHCSV